MPQKTIGARDYRPAIEPEPPDRVDGLKLWVKASDAMLSNNATISTLHPHADNTGLGYVFTAPGTAPTYDIGTMQRDSIDTDGSGALMDSVRDSRDILPAASEALMVAAVIRMPDVSDNGQFGVCGAGGYGVSNSGFRGVDWLIHSSALNFRMKGQDNGTKSATIASGGLTNNQTHVCIGVREHGTNKIHVWLDGSSHDDTTPSSHSAQSMKHASTAADFNLGDRIGAHVTWCLNGFLGEMIWYYRTSDYKNDDVNRVGSYLAGQWGTTWSNATQMAG
tara:strand:- start:7153 stop:7986 length:834 start_codon:yes stop_codon:yes gene_type:complete